MKNTSEPKLIIPKRFGDHRGFFAEIYSRETYRQAGIEVEFVQDNHSLSRKEGTLRGLHFQAPPFAQAKLVQCIRGTIFDIAVDIRVGSPNFGKTYDFVLAAQRGEQLYVPVGFLHGFVTLEPNCEIMYKCSNYYNPGAEGVISYKDPDLKITWPGTEPKVLSERDASAPFLADFNSPFIYGVNS